MWFLKYLIRIVCPLYY